MRLESLLELDSSWVDVELIFVRKSRSGDVDLDWVSVELCLTGIRGRVWSIRVGLKSNRCWRGIRVGQGRDEENESKVKKTLLGDMGRSRGESSGSLF